MKGIVFTEKGRVEIWDHLRNKPLEADEVLLKTLYTGVTVGTECSMLKGGEFPCIGGYQTVSRVEKVGNCVSGISPGQIVFSDYANTPLNYDNLGGCGHMEERVRKTSGNFVMVPEGFRLEEAALLGVMGIGVKAAKRAHVRMGEKVLVIGLGIIGQACAQASAAMGADVYGIDKIPHRMEIARQTSCTDCWNSQCAEMWQEIRSKKKFDVVFETTGLTEMYNHSFEVVQKGTSRLMAVGMRNKQEYEFWTRAHLSEVSIVHTEHFRVEDVCDVMRLVARKRMDIAALITDVRPLCDAVGIYHELLCGEGNHLGVVFDWGNL